MVGSHLLAGAQAARYIPLPSYGEGGGIHVGRIINTASCTPWGAKGGGPPSEVGDTSAKKKI
jgi:hypothetical protein